jgi:hypothetical protein
LIPFFIFKWLRRKGHFKWGWITLLVLWGTPTYIVITAIWPNEGFYEEEFTRHTSLTFPESASFLTKEATYPDQFGDYQSMAVIELASEDYRLIREKLGSDSLFRISPELFPCSPGSGEEFQKHKDSMDLILENTNRGYIKGKAFFQIIFLKDKRTILFVRCSS